MNVGKYTEKAKELVQSSQTNAIALNHPEINLALLMLASLQEESGLFSKLLS